MKRANDIRAQYQLAMDEEGILLAASQILERRLQRQGAITDPNDAADFLKARCAGLTDTELSRYADLEPKEAALQFGEDYDLDRVDQGWH